MCIFCLNEEQCCAQHFGVTSRAEGISRMFKLRLTTFGLKVSVPACGTGTVRISLPELQANQCRIFFFFFLSWYKVSCQSCQEFHFESDASQLFQWRFLWLGHRLLFGRFNQFFPCLETMCLPGIKTIIFVTWDPQSVSLKGAVICKSRVCQLFRSVLCVV